MGLCCNLVALEVRDLPIWVRTAFCFAKTWETLKTLEWVFGRENASAFCANVKGGVSDTLRTSQEANASKVPAAPFFLFKIKNEWKIIE